MVGQRKAGQTQFIFRGLRSASVAAKRATIIDQFPDHGAIFESHKEMGLLN